MQYHDHIQPIHSPITTMRVVKLLLQETGTYNPNFARPYTTQLDAMTLENICQRVSNHPGENLVPNLLAGYASGLASPSAVPHQEIAIPMGWTERRIRFILELLMETRTGNSVIYYFQGYTSHLGVSTTGDVDPNMMFYINSFMRINRTMLLDGSGMYRDTITESAQVINGQLQYQYKSDADDNYTMRPIDIFSGIQHAHLETAYQPYGDMGMTDTRTSLREHVVQSNRKNNIPTNFVSRMLNSYINSKQMEAIYQGEVGVYERCRQTSHEDPLNVNAFIRAIRNIRGGDGVQFSYRDLETIDPNVSYVTNHITLGRAQLAQVHQAGQTAYWDAADRDTVNATVLLNAIPALMLELMISELHFTSTNHDSQGLTSTIIQSVRTLSTADLTRNYELFKHRFAQEIMFDLTYGNQQLFAIEAHMSLFGESWITFSFDQAAYITYTIPSFCDGLMTPVANNSREGFYIATNDYETLFNHVAEASMPSVSPIYTPNF